MCLDDTVSFFLEGFRKIVYLGYMRLLVEGHKYRSMVKENRYRSKNYMFSNGMHELHSTPVKRDGHYVFDMVWTIQVTYGKKKKDGKKRKRDKTPIDGCTIQETIHLLQILAVLGRSRGLPCDRSYASEEECVW